MMPTFYFQTHDFALSDTGFHLLRSGFNYETIAYENIRSSIIKKGLVLHNAWLILLIGTLILYVGVDIAIQLFDQAVNHSLSRAARLAILLFIPVLGGYFVFSATQSAIMIKITYGTHKNVKFPLTDIDRSGRLREFSEYLHAKLKDRMRVKTDALP